MKLLNTNFFTIRDFGDNFTDGSIPPYAIVSHCWTDQEPTYEDVQSGRAATIRGFDKVIKLATIVRANSSHLDWLWIDTCCIDRRRIGEQEAAVARMFEYYARADVCLAYLHDVKFRPHPDRGRQDQFAQSVWFGRGWTLLELLAPREVLFISQHWNILGSRSIPREGKVTFPFGFTCEPILSRTTGIPANVLADFRESKACSVEERLAWMDHRQTTRPEDRWYSMLGIFDVNMTIRYGEGDIAAKARLINEIQNHSGRLVSHKTQPQDSKQKDLTCNAKPQYHPPERPDPHNLLSHPPRQIQRKDWLDTSGRLSVQTSTFGSHVPSSTPDSPVPSFPKPERMRLIRATDQGGSRFTFNLTEFDRDVPSYAILSHVWGPAQGEISFQLLQSVSHSSGDDTQVGWLKMAFCARQAARDGLEHFWIDTCCIDKASSAELAEAINSMFSWYQCAARCYVYLLDVSFSEGTQKMLEQFRVSRWFSRGWTLQELIAPKEVDFFSKEGTYIGSKSTMAHFLAEITKISVGALQGESLDKFSIDERLAWAKDRQTTRSEDKAYSLQGLFDIHMPIIYGERNKAMIRLRDEIDKNRDRGDPSRSFVPARDQGPRWITQ